MRILFIYPNSLSFSSAPISLALLSSCVKKAGHEVKIFDTTFYMLKEEREDQLKMRLGSVQKTDMEPYGVVFKKSTIEELKKDLLRAIEEPRPDICGFTINEPMTFFALELAKSIKQHYDIPIIFGGITATTSPEVIISNDCVDMVCIGEGERALTSLLDAMEKKQSILGIPNLWIKKEGKTIKNEIGPLIDLNELPFLDFDQISDKQFYRPFGGKVHRMLLFERTRGCPFRCSFCENATLQDLYSGKGTFLRRMKPERVIEELKFLKDKYKIEFISFSDNEFFTESEKDLLFFLKKYKKEINLPFIVQARADTANENKLRALKEAGCESVGMSIESGNDYIREKLLNKKIAREAFIKSFNAARAIGLKTNSNNIIGNPGESRKEIFDTIEMNRLCRPYTVSTGFLMPYRGTAIRKFCVEEGYLDEFFVITGSIRAKPVLKLLKISNEELIGLQKTFQLYVKLPKLVYPLIRICEKDNILSKILYPLLNKLMWMMTMK